MAVADQHQLIAAILGDDFERTLIGQVPQIHPAFDFAADDVPVDLIAQILMRDEHAARLKHRLLYFITPFSILAHASACCGGHRCAWIQWEHMGDFYNRPELVRVRAEWKRAGQTVVFTNGCYDILHPGHVRLLEKARSLGDVLILALNTDASVARLKGPTRPLLSQDERAAMAIGLEAVDAVTFFDEDTPRELIADVLPDILIKGADWSHFIAGREEVEAAGGKVMALALEPGFSTTSIVEELLARRP